MTTDKTIKSKYQPKQTNVTWVDLSGKTPVEKHFINGRWQAIGGGGSSNTNPGYNVTKQTVTLFNDTIETQEKYGMYQGLVIDIDFDLVVGETYTVVFDGISYDVKAISSPFQEGIVILGEVDNEGEPLFETYPFSIMYGEEQGGIKGMILFTNTEGPHTFVIKHEEETVTPTPEFKSAVDSVTGYSIDKSGETLYDGTIETIDGHIYGIITPTITFVEGDTYRVTFNGDEYICKCLNDDGTLYVGAPYTVEDTYDWSTYPFNVKTYNPDDGQYETALVANQEGSYTLKIEHLTVSTKTTPEFVSMIQGIAGSGSSKSGCQIIYPDSISWVDTLYSQYNKEPEAGNIYFMPLTDDIGRYLYPVHIDTLNPNGTGTATIIGNIIGTFNDTLVQLDFSGVINPNHLHMSGLEIRHSDNAYRLSYKAGSPFIVD